MNRDISSKLGPLVDDGSPYSGILFIALTQYTKVLMLHGISSLILFLRYC